MYSLKLFISIKYLIFIVQLKNLLKKPRLNFEPQIIAHFLLHFCSFQ